MRKNFILVLCLVIICLWSCKSRSVLSSESDGAGTVSSDIGTVIGITETTETVIESINTTADSIGNTAESIAAELQFTANIPREIADLVQTIRERGTIDYTGP